MSEYDHTCLICGSEQTVHSYSEAFSCDGCGQSYRYQEGHMIDLQTEQVELLRAAAQSREKDGQDERLEKVLSENRRLKQRFDELTERSKKLDQRLSDMNG